MSSTEKLLSILIPLYNEEEYVGVVLERVLHAPIPVGLRSEIIIVDDGSKDASTEVVEAVAARYPGRIHLVRHKVNQGKGAAIRTAIEHATGEFAIIQDADLEYDPNDYPRLLQPLVDERCDAVFGSRFVVAGERKVLYFWHALANGILTTLCNMFADVNLTDMETCYKAFRLALVKSIPLRSNRFGIEPELTIKLAQRQASIIEVPISYYGRTYAEGKKIGLKDAIQALGIILRYGLSRDVYRDNGAAILDALAQTPKFNKWMASVIQPFLGHQVLELGAGIGNLAMHLARHRKVYIASDYDEEHLARLGTRFRFRPNLRIRKVDIELATDFDAIDTPVDTVVCLNVLEHIRDDANGLRNIFNVLDAGGRAIILVPQGMGVYGSLDKVLGHYRRYTEQELQTRVEAAGFRLEHMLRFNRVTRPAWYFNGRILHRERLSRFQLYVFDNLVWLWKKLDTLLPWNPVSIIAVARKPE
ncbi:MAG: glycosyltransferase [Bryobacteraceae bacterium]|nr:glycosyltransferase [Bryobacteraceae bacterium]